MKTVNLISLKHGLKKTHLESHICNSIIEKLNEIPNIHQFKLDPQLVLLACECVENEVYQNKLKKVNKKEMVMNILGKLFQLSDEDKNSISTIIEFLHSNNSIKLLSTRKIVFANCADWITRKFL